MSAETLTFCARAFVRGSVAAKALVAGGLRRRETGDIARRLSTGGRVELIELALDVALQLLAVVTFEVAQLVDPILERHALLVERGDLRLLRLLGLGELGLCGRLRLLELGLLCGLRLGQLRLEGRFALGDLGLLLRLDLG